VAIGLKNGLADDHEEANGEQVLTFWQAQERARKLARGGKNSDHEDDVGRPATLREALDAYQVDLIARGGDLHNVARVRGHLSNTLSAKTVALLTARELRRFRDNLLAKKLCGASVNRISNALRAARALVLKPVRRRVQHFAVGRVFVDVFDSLPGGLEIRPNLIKQFIDLGFKGRVFLFAHFFIDLHHFTECFQPVGISANGLEHLDVGLDLWAGSERGSGDKEQRNGCRKSTHCLVSVNMDRRE
jgi:hypothetical protein